MSTQEERLQAIADAIRAKDGTSEPIPALDFPARIVAIASAPQLPPLANPAGAAQILEGYEAIDGTGEKITGSIPNVAQATPSITVSSTGLITASSQQEAGYVPTGTQSATKQLTTQAAQTITPGTADKTIASGRYLTGTQTIKGDANLVAENIVSGKSIFGVAGTAETVGEEALLTISNASSSSTYNCEVCGSAGRQPCRYGDSRTIVIGHVGESISFVGTPSTAPTVTGLTLTGAIYTVGTAYIREYIITSTNPTITFA